MKTNQEIALEVAKALRQDDLVASLELCTRFLAAVDAERWKDAVGKVVVLEECTTDGVGYRRAWLNSKGALLPDETPLFLSPTIPEGMALVPIVPTEAMLFKLYSRFVGQLSSNEFTAYNAMIQAAGVTK